MDSEGFETVDEREDLSKASSLDDDRLTVSFSNNILQSQTSTSNSPIAIRSYL